MVFEASALRSSNYYAWPPSFELFMLFYFSLDIHTRHGIFGAMLISAAKEKYVNDISFLRTIWQGRCLISLRAARLWHDYDGHGHRYALAAAATDAASSYWPITYLISSRPDIIFTRHACPMLLPHFGTRRAFRAFAISGRR